MKTIDRYLNEKTTDFGVGDIILVGKYRNAPAEVKGFEKDKNNQPVAVTTKGKRNLYNFRIKKLMPKTKDE